MHPAMFLRGSQARFSDPQSGELVQPGSFDHSVSAMVMAACRRALQLWYFDELRRMPSWTALSALEKCFDWPMLVVLQLSADL